MTPEEQNLLQRLQSWKVDSPPSGLAERITARATAHPQERQLWCRVQSFVENFFSDLYYGFSYKVAGLALVGVLGFAWGVTDGAADDSSTVDPAVVDLADLDWTEGL